MADCVSNAAELVERMRLCADDKNVHCKECKFVDTVNNMCMNIMVNCAADAIEALMQENAKLKAERDDWRQKYLSSEADATNLTGLLVQAVADLAKRCNHKLPRPEEDCNFCVHFDDDFDCGGCKWEWRGVQKENADAEEA